jgi:hypothetical protein
VKKTKTGVVMQTKIDSVAKHPRTNAAANEEFIAAAIVSDKAARPSTSGWDPYEVWRTRVKVIQDALAGDIALGQ